MLCVRSLVRKACVRIAAPGPRFLHTPLNAAHAAAGREDVATPRGDRCRTCSAAVSRGAVEAESATPSLPVSRLVLLIA